ncbi:MAG: hypothetical protein JRG89_01340 [Deltaproteobacteria bacterium]|nr:hypothetical protein [Deltaproteobacteria bacterium]MBW2723959.1 hypothetical protein [Deltaproteobacteria bacterium]
MTPKRISAKILVADPAAEIDLHAFIPVFHEFIREKKVEGLLIDVADYSHVPEGPGIVLIGHDVDYSIDQTGGRSGILTLRKRIEGGSLADLLDDTVRKCLLAVKAVQENGSTGMIFSTAALQVQLVDRLAAANSDEGYASFQAEFEGLAARLFGTGATIERADADALRRPLAVDICAANAEDLDTLLARLER